jgi:hypothetical protein
MNRQARKRNPIGSRTQWSVLFCKSPVLAKTGSFQRYLDAYAFGTGAIILIINLKTWFKMKNNIFIALGLLTFALGCQSPKTEVTPEEARAIAKEAYIYGNPMVDHYRIFHSYFIDASSLSFKAPFNQIKNIADVYTYKDTTMQTPNSDTPYGYGGLDLRAEPVVITVPPVDENRYFSVQMIDGFTHNFNYIGTRTTGNGGGNFLFVGPDWKGETPKGFDGVIQSETNLVFAFFRTQLFDPSDIENVKKVQEGYKIQPLSSYLNQTAPAQPEAVNWLKPLTRDEIRSDLRFFNQLNFWMQFATIHESEKELFERFAKIGIVPGETFDPETLAPEIKEAMAAGIQDAWSEFGELNETKIKPQIIGSAEVFGTRAHLNNNYLYRMAGAVLGIYGHSKEECIYPFYQTDGDGQPMNAATNKYTLTMKENEIPPVNAFWSYTMYRAPALLLVQNPIERYLINSPMLENLKRNEDGSITLYIQHTSPGKDKVSNWLPAPNGPFVIANRLYWPKEEALKGTWKPIPIVRVQ